MDSLIRLDEHDREVIEKWADIERQIAAQAAVRKKIRALIKSVGEDVSEWNSGKQFRTTYNPKEGEFYAYRKDWKRRGTSWQDVSLVVGGLSPDYLLTPDGSPYGCVYTSVSDSRKVSETEHEALDSFIRARVTAPLEEWGFDTEPGCPLCQYLLKDDYLAREELYLTPGRMGQFVVEQWDRLLQFADVIDEGLRKLRAGEFKGLK